MAGDTLTVGELMARLMDVPNSALIYGYMGPDGVKVQAEWTASAFEGPPSAAICTVVTFPGLVPSAGSRAE